MRVLRNCAGTRSDCRLPFDWAPGGVLHQCPMSLIPSGAWDLFGAWRDWKIYGALPEVGDALDQPAPIFEALAVCEQAKADIEDKLRQERERELDQTKKKTAADAEARRR